MIVTSSATKDTPQVAQRGYTLIELMIGLLIGTIVLAAAVTFFVTLLSGQRDHNQIVRLNQDVRAMADLMVRDIRRAGFLTANPASNAALLLNNPYFNTASAGATTDLNVLNSGSCILYAYNADNTDPPSVATSHRFGFRLSGTDVQIRISGDTNENCTNGSWETMNSPGVDVASLVFTVSSAEYNATTESVSAGSCSTGESCVVVRTVNMTLDAELESDSSIQQSIEETIRIRNDKFIESYP